MDSLALSTENSTTASQRFLEGLGLLSDALGRAFGANKASAIANAIINTAQGVTKALSLGPVGIPLAAVIGALGLAQISKISSTSFGSGGGGGGGGSVPTGFGNPRFGGNSQIGIGGPKQEITIFIDGSAVFAATPEDLARELGDALRDQFGAAGADVEVF